MKALFRVVLAVMSLTSAYQVAAQSMMYESLESWQLRQQTLSAGSSFRSGPEASAVNRSLRVSARPQVSGLRPRSVEMLEDAMLRKASRRLGRDPAKARELVRRTYMHGRGFLRGYTAEALFIERNPRWGYVESPNATQHDVYRWRSGRRAPFTGQIKFHASGRPAQYARDMVLDHRAHRFFIPDDHVEPTKAFLRDQARQLEARGDMAAAKRLWRDYGRLRPIGASSREIDRVTREAAIHITRERYASYVAMGAGFAIAFGPTLLDVARGKTTVNVAAYNLAKGASIAGAGYGADRLLKSFRGGALRGTANGTVVIGAAIALAQTTWLLYEYGWSRAFYSPDFYEEMVGGISSLTLALSAAYAATGIAMDAGVWGPFIVAVAGTAGGLAGYYGGRRATRMILELVAPDMLRQRERERFQSVATRLQEYIAATQQLAAR